MSRITRAPSSYALPWLACVLVTGCPPPGIGETESATQPGSSGTTGDPTTGDDPTTGPPPPAATCEARRTETQAILAAHCGACHGDQGKGNFSNITDLEGLVATGKVVPKDSANSYLFQRIVNGEMPPAPNPPVPPEEQAAIQAWIDECSTPTGTASADPQKPPECPPDAAVTTAQWLDMIHADLALLDPNDWKFQRYVSFLDLYNAGYCEAQLVTYRHALNKLLNSLSQETDLGYPAVVAGSHDTIFRVDLRDYGWSADLWDKIACANPYSVDYGINDTLPVAAAIQDALKDQKGTKVRLFVQPGRSFMDIIARPPLYHDILEIPATLAELAKLKSNIDSLSGNALAEQNNEKEDLVLRAGFYDSGVSFSNRMIERQKVPGEQSGYFWHSFDFADNDGLSDIFAHPLDFVVGGGEVIFSLPNQLQAYMIVDNFGNRIDKAPENVVQDPDNDDNRVENGISCMGCHESGIIVKADEIRAYVELNPEKYESQAIVLGVQNLHPQSNVVDVQTKDSNRFMGALESLGVPHVIETGGGQQVEPIRLTGFAFEQNVNLERAATEIGTTTEKVISIQNQVPDVSLLFGGGTLKREDFVDVFAPAVEALLIGDAQPIAACTPG